MKETSGVLAAVIERYLNHKPLDSYELAIMRAYLRQWIMAPGWTGVDVEELRKAVELIETQRELERWLEVALDAGIDPL